MVIQEFIETFAEQFEETDLALFAPETEFKKLDEWSSLMSLSIIAMADDEYDIQLKGEDIRNASTINDLFEIIKAKQK